MKEATSIRLLSDENFNRTIVAAIRRQYPYVDFLTAQKAGTLGLPDPAVLAFSAREGRILVSHDVHTMAQHYAAFLAAGNHSAGVILIPQTLSIRAAIESLMLIWQVSSSEEWIDKFEQWP